MSRTTRRSFVALAAAAPVAAQQTTTAAPQAQPRRQGPPPEVPPFDATLEFRRKDVAAKVEPFPLTQVRVTGGIYKDAQEWNRGYMQRLAADRLLYNFRQNAGLPAGPAEPLGGWEAPADGKRGTELRGHFTGHFLTAAAQLYASTGDQEAKAKGDSMVAELAKVQEKLGGGYLSAFPHELFDRLDALSGKPRPPQDQPQLPWAPFYTIHKIMAGMLDMHTLAGNQQALKVAEGMADWADRWSASKTEAHMQEILNVEYGGIGETLYNLAAVTKNDQWAKAGDRFHKKRFLNPLGMRRDELRGLHVNTHIPQVIAAAKRYELSGDMRFRDVSDFFWWEVVTARSYVTTGTSNSEGWQAQPRQLAAELRNNPGTATAECCCAYNMMKLTRHLYGWTGEPGYFDYYERSLLNHRIGTILPEKGYTQYYLSLKPGAWKTFNTEDKSFWCCTGTGVEEYSKLNDSIYWRDAQGLYVNLFIPSELNWEEKGFRLRQETKFPDQQSTALVVTAARPGTMAIRVRVPAWLRSAPTVKVNGRALEASAAPGSYLTLSRAWKAGDRIEMELPMQLSAESTPDDSGMQAFLYGPLVLAGDLGAEGLEERRVIGPSAPPMRANAVPPIEVPTFRATGSEVSSWIKAEGPMRFRTTGQKRDVTLVPLNSLFGKRYSVYWQVG